MNILFISKYYKNYLNYFDTIVHKYNKNLSYNELYSIIINDRYFWSDYFKQELLVHGYNVEQLIIDAKKLQIQWAKEHGISYSKNNWYLDIVIQQIKYYKPDILFIQDWSKELGSEFIQLIKYHCSFVKIFIGYCGEGHPSPSYFKDHNFVISCAKDNVDFFKKKGLHAYHIYHAFFPDIHKQLTKEYSKDFYIGFIGRVYPDSIFHRQRAIFLAALSEKIIFHIHGEVRSSRRYKKYSKLDKIQYDFLSLFDKYLFGRIKKIYTLYQEEKMVNDCIKKLQFLQKEQYFGLKMFDLTRRYNILLNYHSSPLFAANLRMFEVTGMGTCLVTDWKENIKELFEPDIEIVTFKNVDEAKEKIDFLQRNHDVVKSISLAGQKKTLRDHTYAKRAEDMHNIFSDYLNKYYKKSV